MSNEIQKYNAQGGMQQSTKDMLGSANENLKNLELGLAKFETPRMFYQLVIFVVDGSRSMNSKSINGISKGKEIDRSIKNVLTRLRDSKNENGFDIAYYVFSDEYKNLFGIKCVNKINENQDFNPFEIIDNPAGTQLNDCIQNVSHLIDDYFSKHIDKNCQAIVLLLSDGAIDDYNMAVKEAEKLIKTPKVTLAAMYLESPIDKDSEYYSWNEATGVLDYSQKWNSDNVKISHERTAQKFKLFASKEELFITSIDPEKIRKHMIESISTLSKIEKCI